MYPLELWNDDIDSKSVQLSLLQFVLALAAQLRTFEAFCDPASSALAPRRPVPKRSCSAHRPAVDGGGSVKIKLKIESKITENQIRYNHDEN